jgi:hypothetical protein
VYLIQLFISSGELVNHIYAASSSVGCSCGKHESKGSTWPGKDFPLSCWQESCNQCSCTLSWPKQTVPSTWTQQLTDSMVYAVISLWGFIECAPSIAKSYKQATARQLSCVFGCNIDALHILMFYFSPSQTTESYYYAVASCTGICRHQFIISMMVWIMVQWHDISYAWAIHN